MSGAIRELEVVGEKSAGLRRELRLRDLVLMQILLVMGIGWVGTAARQGSTHVALWALALATFYLPTAKVVVFLSRQMPLEGGIYQWVKIGLGPLPGFLAAWNLWLFVVIGYAAVGLTVATSLSYAFGPGATWMAGNKPAIASLNALAFAAIYFLNARGFRVARFAIGAGAAMMIGVYAVLFGLLCARWGSPAPFAHRPFSLALPTLSLMSVNLFSKIALSALSGFEHSPVFAGECRDPARDLWRSTWIAAPVIVVLYAVGTGALLAYTPPGRIDLIGPIQQALSIGLGDAGPLGVLRPIAILALTLVFLAQAVASVAEAARMPMVAGWDRLLPEWVSRLHPRHGTPTRSIALVVLACFGLGTLSLIGVGQQEALQTTLTAGVACGGVYYLLMLAIPLLGARRLAVRPSPGVRVAAGSAAVVTLLSIAFQLYPIVDVASPLRFSLKVAALALGANGIGVALYRFAGRL